MANLRNVAVWLDTILTQIQSNLVADSVVASTNCLMSTEQDQPPGPPGAEQFLVLVPGPQVPDQGAVRGGGNTTPFMTGQIGVVCWARLWVDKSDRKDKFLTDSTKGVLQLMRKVLKSLQMFDPQNGSSDYYLLEPMRLGNSGWMLPSRKTEAGWGSVSASFEVKYLADLVS